MADENTPEVYLVKVLEELGFTETDAKGLINHDFGDTEVDWHGLRVSEGVTLRAFVSSYSWRIGVRLATLVLAIEGLRVEGSVELWPGEFDLAVTNFLSRLRGKAPRQHVGDAAFEARYGIHAPTEQEARRALTAPLRQALLAAALETHVRLMPDHIALFPTSDSVDSADRSLLAHHTVRLAERIIAALPREPVALP